MYSFTGTRKKSCDVSLGSICHRAICVREIFFKNRVVRDDVFGVVGKPKAILFFLIVLTGNRVFNKYWCSSCWLKITIMLILK